MQINSCKSVHCPLQRFPQDISLCMAFFTFIRGAQPGQVGLSPGYNHMTHLILKYWLMQSCCLHFGMTLIPLLQTDEAAWVTGTHEACTYNGFTIDSQRGNNASSSSSWLSSGIMQLQQCRAGHEQSTIWSSGIVPIFIPIIDHKMNFASSHLGLRLHNSHLKQREAVCLHIR